MAHFASSSQSEVANQPSYAQAGAVFSGGVLRAATDQEMADRAAVYQPGSVLRSPAFHHSVSVQTESAIMPDQTRPRWVGGVLGRVGTESATPAPARRGVVLGRTVTGIIGRH